MKNNKVLLSLAMFIMMMTGCGPIYYNVVKGVNGCNILVEDVKTHQERIVKFANSNYNRYLLYFTYTGDTVVIQTKHYDKLILRHGISTSVSFDGDSIDARYYRQEFFDTKAKLFNQKVK